MVHILTTSCILAGICVMVDVNILSASKKVSSAVNTLLRSAANTASGLVKCVSWCLLVAYSVSGTMQSVHENRCFDSTGQENISALVGMVRTSLGLLCVSSLFSIVNVVQ